MSGQGVLGLKIVDVMGTKLRAGIGLLDVGIDGADGDAFEMAKVED